MTLEDDCFLLTTRQPWRSALRLPTLRIPLGELAMVWKTARGIQFVVPGHDDLDGACFFTFSNSDRLLALLRELRVPVQVMPWRERVRGWLREFAIAQRPGFLWRDRGWPAFVESGLAFAVASLVGFLILRAVPSEARGPMLVWIGFIVFVVLWSGFAGHHYRK